MQLHVVGGSLGDPIGPPVVCGVGAVVAFIDPEGEPVVLNQASAGRFALSRGGKRYELKNHLGNVLSVVTDLKLGQGQLNVAPAVVDFYLPEVVEVSDYFPFGWQLPGRNWRSGGRYRYAFQAQEGDDEWSGEEASVFFKYRVHDARIGRFLSVDPLAAEYAGNSVYAFSENRVLDGVELEGLERAGMGNNYFFKINPQHQGYNEEVIRKQLLKSNLATQMTLTVAHAAMDRPETGDLILEASANNGLDYNRFYILLDGRVLEVVHVGMFSSGINNPESETRRKEDFYGRYPDVQSSAAEVGLTDPDFVEALSAKAYAQTNPGGGSVRKYLGARSASSGASYSSSPLFKSLQGKSISWIKRQKPKGWSTEPTRGNEVWLWRDENGIERLRFIRPNGKTPTDSDWSRQSNGYFRWKNSKNEWLDIDGKVVPLSDRKFNERTHIPYEGNY